MDIDLLSKMVSELILDSDEVALPGVGTFVAEEIPSSFSDKGYTINPPYRRLSFRQRESSDTGLVDLYARSNGVTSETASSIILPFLKEMVDVLKEKKTIIFPGLGRLRATRENNFFFVPDEDLNIYPDGFGLEAVSLKTHVETEDEVQSAMADLQTIMESDVTEAVEEETPTQDTEEFFVEPAEDQESEPQEAIVPVVQEAPAVQESPAIKEVPEACVERPVNVQKKPASRGVWWKVILAVVIAAAVFLLLFVLLARIAPDFIDTLLYSDEELEIIRNFKQ